MTRGQFERFVSYLRKNDWSIFGPVFTIDKIEKLPPLLAAHQSSPIKKTGQILIERIADPAKLDLSGQLPFFSFKRFFVPAKECIFKYKQEKLTAQKYTSKIYPERGMGTALAGVGIKDLKAINLYDQVFEKDPHYQARRRKLLIIGYSAEPANTANTLKHEYENEALEHLSFDIFLGQTDDKQATAAYKVFAGSIKGQRILEHFGYKNYEHVQFDGPITKGTAKENESRERMDRLCDRLKNHPDPKIWEKLGKICVECGKCSLVCPTCFCFHVDDEPDANGKSGMRTRGWDSCFYQEFSEVAGPSKIPEQGGHKFLKTTAERINFWYFHKFARIPDEFGFTGCVGCHRCATVCPVNIDIKNVLSDIENA